MKQRTFLLMVAVGAAMLLASGAALATTKQTFSNSTPIEIGEMDSSLTANPYPSPITVSGVTGQVRDVNVILRGFAHRAQDDVDMLLEGPQGQVVSIMSDTGAFCDDVDGKTIKLSDQARRVLPDARCLRSRSYKPKDWEEEQDPDYFSPPAPQDRTNDLFRLKAFNGTDPNGTWKLYVSDDYWEAEDGWILRGWALEITAG